MKKESTKLTDVGPDPIIWLDRLIDVNETSAFSVEQKAVIKEGFEFLRDMLKDLQ